MDVLEVLQMIPRMTHGFAPTISQLLTLRGLVIFRPSLGMMQYIPYGTVLDGLFLWTWSLGLVSPVTLHDRHIGLDDPDHWWKSWK